MSARKRKASTDQPETKNPSKKKQSSLNNFFSNSSSSTSQPNSENLSKPVLVILPGASGKLSKAFNDILIPMLSQHFDITVREGKWANWNLSSKENVQSVLSVCSSKISTEPWYILGHSFGCRMIVSMILNNQFPVAPCKSILASYPMYGDKGTSERVDLLQSIQQDCDLLCISGSKDEFLTRGPEAAKFKHDAENIYKSILSELKCKDSVQLQMVPNGGHGLIDVAKSQQGNVVNNVVNWIVEFVKPK